ncbi:MAG: pantoate--beta-alanine ligase [Chloroflexi bacterium]|nr:pantoate--beta-alanine ligase [Chloroflexota bacterium]OJW06516.1 MAG: pantoate--beta-alanine ligase [Chloroflexi bacterium 54-19]
MQLITTVEEMAARREEWRAAGKTVGLVPTMGYLHQGHLSLAERSRQENDLTVASIFVNPLQFGPKEDFGRYPRDLDRDLKLLESVGVAAVFHPEPSEMYPPGFDASVEVGGITGVLEGAARPGHFKGVTTVVAKLFNIVGARRAYFGQKDAQQVAVLRKMVRDLNFPLQLVVCPTMREPDGLAMSSRNVYLSPEERQAAPALYRALQAAAQLWQERPDERSGPALRAAMENVLAGVPLGKADYVSAADPLTLQEYAGAVPPGQGALLSMAVRFGSTRLIDNMPLEGAG